MRRLVPIAAALLAAGCSLFSPKTAVNQQLENVAKEWCRTMRASQVLCVYPLSEDVQVGDIYMVNTSIANQVAQYNAKGFLPFDMLLTRLQPANYRAMYASAYGTQDQWSNIPHQWQFPPNAVNNNWAAAPHAAFPTYTFNVQQGQGLKLAVPVQAVPIGLSLMNSTQAQGSIEIGDASTYGIDQRSIDAQVNGWANCPATRALLARYGPDAGGNTTHYLRVITRVYLTGKVNVSLQRDDSRGAGVDAGVAQAGNVLSGQTYSELLDKLNNTIGGKSGGSVRITAVSGRSVSMTETFDRPLVIGYIAYDRAIGPNGSLGDPRPTLQQVEGTVPPAPQPSASDMQSVRFGADANSRVIRQWVASDENRATLNRWLQQQSVPLSIPMILNDADSAALRERIVDYFNLGGPCGSADH
jgi:hypothetical protein